MGYVSNDGYLYMPKGYYYYSGESIYTYPFPFIIQSSDSMNITGTILREIGKTTNLFSVGSINLDGAFVNPAILSSNKLYIYRYNDGTSNITTVCTIPDLQNAISGKLDAPSTAGTEGQVLMLNSSLQPVWGRTK